MNGSIRRSGGQSRIVSIALGALVVVLAVVFRVPLTAWFMGKSLSDGASPVRSPQGGPNAAAPAPAASGSAGEIDHYTCSMHPSVKQAGPGKCPICGMESRAGQQRAAG